MMRVIYLLAAVAATASVPILAAPGQSNSSTRMVCKYQKVTGSRLGRERVCMRQSDWDLLDAEVRRDADKTTIPTAPLEKPQ